MRNYFGILVILITLACNNTEKKSAELKDSTSSEASKPVAVSFENDKLSKIYSSYISLKDALVAAKPEEAKSSAKSLSAELKNFSGCENTSIIADKIENGKDLLAQRKEFTQLSSDVIALFKHADLTKGTIYVQHCPMANNGDGGDWLASEKKVLNPYYGDEMLNCGAVIEEIKAK